jgi:uncharacterized damage-inducible protein DinB
MTGLLTPSQLLEILEGNRRLTLRTIQAFSEKDLFQYSPVEPMRPFAGMVAELLGLEDAYVRGIATGEWAYNPAAFKAATTTGELLAACEAVRRQTLEWWPRLTAERLLTVEKDPFFGPAMSHFDRLQYCVENENHHRGQAFVYLRLLGIEPPPFWER